MKQDAHNQVVLFGGTFDPVHHGHLIVARAVAEHCGFKRVIFVPAGNRPHKPPAEASPQHRLEMLRLAVDGQDVFEISEFEIVRAEPSYTVDTISHFKGRFGDEAQINWLVGADMLADLPNWRDAGEILRLAKVITAARSPQEHRMESIFAELSEKLGPEHVKELQKTVIPTPIVDISASQIRRRVADGKSIRFLTPEVVCDYIRGRNLYHSAE